MYLNYFKYNKSNNDVYEKYSVIFDEKKLAQLYGIIVNESKNGEIPYLARMINNLQIGQLSALTEILNYDASYDTFGDVDPNKMREYHQELLQQISISRVATIPAFAVNYVESFFGTTLIDSVDNVDDEHKAFITYDNNAPSMKKIKSARKKYKNDNGKEM